MVGKKPKYNLSPDKIERLEEIGLNCKCSEASNVAFEKRCRELMEFKEIFGHCNVPATYVDNVSLGLWCRKLRWLYNIIQKGFKPDRNLSPDRIKCLEEIGFQWTTNRSRLCRIPCIQR